jgi:HSP20 family protein
MSMVRWDPFSNIATLQDRINRLFDDAFPATGENEEDIAACAWRPMVDIYETAEGAAIKVDLPGVEKSDVSVEVKENILTIKGRRRSDITASEDQFYRRERATGDFQRSFALRSMIAPDRIKASFKNGVLTIDVPKPESKKPKQVTVDID